MGLEDWHMARILIFFSSCENYHDCRLMKLVTFEEILHREYRDCPANSSHSFKARVFFTVWLYGYWRCAYGKDL